LPYKCGKNRFNVCCGRIGHRWLDIGRRESEDEESEILFDDSGLKPHKKFCPFSYG
jgi:hypothetical protein